MNTSKTRGDECEQIASNYYRSHGLRLLHKNKKVAGVEIDLIFQGLDCLLMVEVKSFSDSTLNTFRVSKNQKRRLLMARDFFQEKVRRPVQMKVCFVKSSDELFDLPIAEVL
ncbi:MAG: YraN family protein [Pseudomonadota bacterium]